MGNRSAVVAQHRPDADLMITRATLALQRIRAVQQRDGVKSHDYRGHRCPCMGGGLNGFRALFSFNASAEDWYLVLTNGESLLSEIVTFNVYDRLLGLEHVPWNKRFKRATAEQKEAVANREKRVHHAEDRKPPGTP